MTAETTVPMLGMPPRGHRSGSILLFSGHMIDRPERPVPRFPPEMEPRAREAIAHVLDELDVGSDDIGIFGGACGGDLLFAEVALERGATLEMYLPFEEARFLDESVDFAGPAWRQRYRSIRARCSLVDVATVATARDGLKVDRYAMNNTRMLAAAGRFGPDRLEFICLWDGRSGDGPGGTQHLMHEVARRQGRTHWIDTNKLLSTRGMN